MLTIIGCGNANRSDDAVGVVVARRVQQRLARHPVPGVQAFDCGTAGVEVMLAARDSDAVILVDAARTGAEPGEIFEAPGDALAQERVPSLNLHDFRWDHALVAGARMYGQRFPSCVTVFLVEAAQLRLGVELSPVVAQAADRVYALILERIAAWAVGRHAAMEDREVTIDRGWIRIERALYDCLFDGREGVVPFMLEGRLCLMPVQQVAGGLLVKVRNAYGDRAIDAAEVLRANGWEAWDRYTCRASWDSSLGALALTPPPGAVLSEAAPRDRFHFDSPQNASSRTASSRTASSSKASVRPQSSEST